MCVCVCVQVVHESVAVVEMKEPYIAGFLAFRDVDFLLDRLRDTTLPPGISPL